MTKEEEDFIYFKENQLANINITTGQIDIYTRTKSGSKILVKNVGYKNPDGYIRFWANKTLRMKHRFIFWYVYGYLPKEINHKDFCRDNNSISNLEASNRSLNTTGKRKREPYNHLSEPEIHKIFEMYRNGVSITKLSKIFYRSRCALKALISGKTYRDITSIYFQ